MPQRWWGTARWARSGREVRLPEGDSIFKLARRLRPLLVGERLVRLAFEGRRSEIVPSRPVVDRIDTVGKHLLIHLEARRVLRVHLGLHGAFRRLGADEPLPRAPALSLLLQTDQTRVVCVRARTVELFGEGLLPRHPVLSRLGPDLLAEPVQWEVVGERVVGVAPRATISDVLLDQHVAAGLGKVYRNELLFLHGLHPDIPAGELPVGAILSLFRDGARQLRWNLDSRLRITTRDVQGRVQAGLPRHYVYGRTREPCLTCHTPVRRGRSARDARPSFWCPRCQPRRRGRDRPSPSRDNSR